jgi:hypothetical protein
MAFDFHNLLDESKIAFEKIGLYTMSSNVGAVPAAGAELELMEEDVQIDEVLRDGKADFFLVTTMRIGDVAFSERVLEPDKLEEKVKFESIAPTELEMLRQQLAEERKEWEEGWE